MLTEQKGQNLKSVEVQCPTDIENHGASYNKASI